jgi:hypothetical protein
MEMAYYVQYDMNMDCLECKQETFVTVGNHCKNVAHNNISLKKLLLTTLQSLFWKVVLLLCSMLYSRGRKKWTPLTYSNTAEESATFSSTLLPNNQILLCLQRTLIE